ncbi:translation initiation factor 2 [Streptomyces carpaticus]|uniref:translation initiation factor 2 n=1 Tax=Streptomyces carpaticus TaxID=285558 RepID=UPI0031F82B55
MAESGTAGSGQRAAGSGQRAAGSGQRAAGSGQRAAGSGLGTHTVLCVARSATTLHRLLDVLPVFAGDHRVTPLFTLAPGSAYDTDALAALDGAGARTIPWDEAVTGAHHRLALAASPNGALHLLPGPLALLPHGAGFNKHLAGRESATGLDPGQLLHAGRPLADLHALAHPSQLARLARTSPTAAAPAKVTGDPTLERLHHSQPGRARYRAALGTGDRRLIVLTSTFGPESLLARRPELPQRLTATLPYDTYQVALVLHPNARARHGAFALHQWLAPALRAGLVLPGPYEEWGAALIAADLVITDHGSTALYAAALDRPLIGAYDGGRELVPDSPMAQLLAQVPRLTSHAPYPGQLAAALAGHRPGSVRPLADPAFAARGSALDLLRTELYRLLGLDPPPGPVLPVPLPEPGAAPEPVTAFTVETAPTPDGVRVSRFPAAADGPPGDHLAADADRAALGQLQTAALLYRRGPATGAPDWPALALAEYPACRTAAQVLAPDRCTVRTRAGARLAVVIDHGPGAPVDPSAVLSAVHARRPTGADRFRCHLGDRTVGVQLSPL